jgi:hypothetical protein
MADGANTAGLPAKAWDEFCDQLRALGRDIVGEGYPSDPIDQVDGYHHVALLVESGLRWYLDSGDAEFPRLCRLDDTAEVADNWFAPISSEHTYRLTGSAAHLFDINVSVHAGWGFLGQRGSWGDLGFRDFDIAEDGSFEVILSAEKHEGNWLELSPEARLLQVRGFYSDWDEHTSGAFDLVRVGSEGQAPPRATPESLAAGLEGAAAYARGYLEFHKATVEGGSFPAEPNTINEMKHFAGGNRNLWYGMGAFDLERGQALLVGFDAPNARMWNAQWLNRPWYANPDLLYHQTSLVGTHSHVDADGRIRFVLCADDPGIPNWLDTGGYHEGVFVVRWFWADESPEVTARLVGVDELRDALPADHPHTTPEERAAQLDRRRRHLQFRGRGGA